MSETISVPCLRCGTVQSKADMIFNYCNTCCDMVELSDTQYGVFKRLERWDIPVHNDRVTCPALERRGLVKRENGNYTRTMFGNAVARRKKI